VLTAVTLVLRAASVVSVAAPVGSGRLAALIANVPVPALAVMVPDTGWVACQKVPVTPTDPMTWTGRPLEVETSVALSTRTPRRGRPW
jgi:hypothetical protein